MSCLFLGGQYFNLLSRANAITPSDSDAVLGATSALYDGVPSSPAFMFGTLGADRAVVIDIDQLDGFGSFDAWTTGVPNGWTAIGSGTLTQENTIKVAGASALKCTNNKGVTRQYLAKSGELAQLSGWLRGDGTANGVMRVRVQNKQTFLWLQANGTWGASVADILTQQSASGPGTQGYTSAAFSFQVESFAKCLADSVTLEVTLICTGSGSAYADSIIVTPGVNFWSVHSHNIDPGIVPTLYWSDDNSAFTSAGTVAVGQPSFYITLGSTPLYHRYWRGSLIGTNSAQTGKIWMGQFVLGQSLALQRAPKYPISTSIVPNSVRIGQAPAHVWVLQKGSYDPRGLSMKFSTGGGTAAFKEHRDELTRRVRMGAFNCVFVPDDTDPDVCLFGIVVDRKTFEQQFVTYWDCDAGFIEQPVGVGIS